MCFNAICGRVNKEATKMSEAIQRVRDFHQEEKRESISFCAACVDHENWGDWQQWPCDTIKALDGE